MSEATLCRQRTGEKPRAESGCERGSETGRGKRGVLLQKLRGCCDSQRMSYPWRSCSASEGMSIFHTGNLEFAGEVYVSGSIARGFSVKAGAGRHRGWHHRARCDRVDKGRYRGGTGNRGPQDARLRRRQRESPVRAGSGLSRRGKISPWGAMPTTPIFAPAARVVIARSQGSRGGSIMGGKTWGRQGIETHTAGDTARDGFPSSWQV